MMAREWRAEVVDEGALLGFPMQLTVGPDTGTSALSF
jgi:hypothetical protein